MNIHFISKKKKKLLNDNFEEKITKSIDDNMFYKNKNRTDIKTNKKVPLIDKSKTKITYIRKNDLDEDEDN